MASTKDISLDYRVLETDQQIFAVAQNHPNPWTDQTSVSVYMPEAGLIELEVYNTNGQVVHTNSYRLEAGHQMITIRSEELNGSGLYHYKLSSGRSSVTRRFLLIE